MGNLQQSKRSKKDVFVFISESEKFDEKSTVKSQKRRISTFGWSFTNRRRKFNADPVWSRLKFRKEERFWKNYFYGIKLISCFEFLLNYDNLNNFDEDVTEFNEENATKPHRRSEEFTCKMVHRDQENILWGQSRCINYTITDD